MKKLIVPLLLVLTIFVSLINGVILEYRVVGQDSVDKFIQQTLYAFLTEYVIKLMLIISGFIDTTNRYLKAIYAVLGMVTIIQFVVVSTETYIKNSVWIFFQCLLALMLMLIMKYSKSSQD